MLEIEWVTEMAGLNAAFVACVPTSGSIVFNKKIFPFQSQAQLFVISLFFNLKRSKLYDCGLKSCCLDFEKAYPELLHAFIEAKEAKKKKKKPTKKDKENKVSVLFLIILGVYIVHFDHPPSRLVPVYIGEAWVGLVQAYIESELIVILIPFPIPSPTPYFENHFFQFIDAACPK